MNSSAGLPGRLDSFVGREREIERLAELLATSRLLTITGPGGVGKTRLAIQAAELLGGGFADGVRFVDLSALRDPQDVLPRVAQACGIVAHERAAILARLRAEGLQLQALVLLDNVEQVLEAAPDLAALLESAPRLVVLATSRAPLRIPGEQEFALAPLEPPPPGARDAAQLLRSPAIRLFLLRAQQVRPDFVLGDANAPAVAEICRRLDGLPLAIELAAARTRLLQPPQLLERLADRLGLLAGSAGGTPDRHRTLRATIAWSYDLLGEPARRLFCRLAVFSGGATLEAIEAVCAEPGWDLLEQLEELVAQSLVLIRAEADGAARFVLLETIAAYAAEQLAASGAQADLRARHAAYYCALGERAAPRLTGGGQRSALQLLAAEYANLQAMFSWSLAHDGGVIAQRLGGALWRFFWLHGHLREGRRWLERALADDPGTARPPASEHERQALLRRSRAWRSLGNLAWAQVDYPASEAAHRRGLDLARAASDAEAIGAALHGVGVIRANLGDYDAAEQLYVESLVIRHRIGDDYGAATTLNNLGFVAEQRGDDRTARAFYQESAALKRRIGEQAATAKSLIHLGEVELRLADREAARKTLAEALALAEAADAQIFVSEVIHWAACLAAADGRAAQAARLFGAAEARYARYGAQLHIEDYPLTVEQVRAAREQLQAEAFAQAWQAGRQLDDAKARDLVGTILTPPPLSPQAAPSPAAPPQPPLAEPLSEREHEVLQLLAGGLSNPAIAARLTISVNTVQTHLRNIYGKLGVATRGAAISFAYRHGLIAGAPDDQAGA